MGVLSFPVIAGAQLTKTDTSPFHEPGTIMMVRQGTSVTAQQYALVKYVRFELALNKGDAVGWMDSTDTERVELCSTTQGITNQGFRGIAAATTTASGMYGWIFIHGYVPYIRVSSAVATGNYLCLSGSTAGRWVKASSSFNATAGVSSANGTWVAGTPAVALGAGSNASGSTVAAFLMSVWG